jgi:ubiquinone/menaquinone biosynthesis C-methylase UbiE
MPLKETYETRTVHDNWEAVYRGNSLQDRLNARIMDRALAALRPPPDAHFLDAGCGVGYHSVAIARRGYRCTGIDIAETILQTARNHLTQPDLAARLSFRCEALERLSFDDATFDVVHCRGVLMHIPQWEQALSELCRVLKPGGGIVIMEANRSSLEAWLVRLLRRLRRAKSRLESKPGGLEFWSEVDGRPFVVRMADMRYLAGQLEGHGVRVERRFATELWDIYRFRSGPLRNAAVRWNQLWFRLRLPASLSAGNAVIGRKTSG